MRRLLLLSLMGAVAVFPPSLEAQRGRAAGGGVRAAPRSAAPARAHVAPSVRGGARFAPGRLGHPFVVSRFGRRGFFINSGCFGYPYYCPGSYYPYSTLYYPPLFWPDTGYAQQPYPIVQPTYDDTALRDEVDRLANEVERLRQEQQARQAPQPGARPAAEPATVLVFRDGHRSEVQNYGIVGETLWVFTERHARKCPLSDLDLPATKAANDQRGVEFTVPELPPTPRQPLKPMSPGMPNAVPDDPVVLKAAQQSANWK